MTQDVYDELLAYYEFLPGELPKRDEFKGHLQRLVSPEEVQVVLKLPFAGKMPYAELFSEAGVPDGRLRVMLSRLAREGFVQAYDAPQGRILERGNVSFMTEQQVRKEADTPLRTFLAEFFNQFIEGRTRPFPNKTPYFRVVPREAALDSGSRTRTIPVGVTVPDTREVLPFEVLSELLKTVDPIGVAQCYCRKAKRVIHQGCDHLLETCFVFDGIGKSLIESGIARQLPYFEAMEILRECDRQGLVHQADNAREIHALCNCCSCCCVVLKAWNRGATNAGGPSRFVVRHDAALCRSHGDCARVCPTGTITLTEGRLRVTAATCIGCGQCVASCPEGALHLEPRVPPPEVTQTHHSLTETITNEIVGALLTRR